MAGTSLKDPMKYKPDVVRHVEAFNKAVEHFRRNGHKWEQSPLQKGFLTQLYLKETYESFETWILHTQAQYGGHNRMERQPADA